MNTNTIRSNWRGFQKQKKEWQEEIEILLMVQGVSSGQRAMAGCFMRFPDLRRRDPSNFAGVVNKALGDALVNFRAIPDDDESHYFFGGVEFEGPRGPARTRIVVYLQRA